MEYFCKNSELTEVAIRDIYKMPLELRKLFSAADNEFNFSFSMISKLIPNLQTVLLCGLNLETMEKDGERYIECIRRWIENPESDVVERIVFRSEIVKGPQNAALASLVQEHREELAELEWELEYKFEVNIDTYPYIQSHSLTQKHTFHRIIAQKLNRNELLEPRAHGNKLWTRNITQKEAMEPEPWTKLYTLLLDADPVIIDHLRDVDDDTKIEKFALNAVLKAIGERTTHILQIKIMIDCIIPGSLYILYRVIAQNEKQMWAALKSITRSSTDIDYIKFEYDELSLPNGGLEYAEKTSLVFPVLYNGERKDISLAEKTMRAELKKHRRKMAREKIQKATRSPMQAPVIHQNSSSSMFSDLLTMRSLQEVNGQELWTTHDIEDKPLFRLNAAELFSIVSQWIKNDVKYMQTLKELKFLLNNALQPLPEDVPAVSIIHRIFCEKQEDLEIIEDILKELVPRYLTSDTVVVIIQSTKNWFINTDGHFKREASIEEMAQLFMEFPLRSLKKAISYEQVDGEEIMENPDAFGKLIKSATGWSASECQQITEILLKRSSFTKIQILKSVQDIASKNGLSQLIIDKMKSTLFECDLENVHYQLRTKGIMDHEFGDMVLNLLRELIDDKLMKEIDIAHYFNTISSALIMMINGDPSQGHRPWQCVCCGNLNVHKIIEYQMVTNIPICSLCGITQMEGITMAIKNIKLPFQVGMGNVSVPNPNENAKEDQKSDDNQYSLSFHARKRSFDLHCMAQRDSSLCPNLKFIATVLIDQRRKKEESVLEQKERDKNLTEDEWRSIDDDEYRETFLKIASEVMTEEQPDGKDATVETLTKMFDDKRHEICEFARYFVKGGERRKLLDILRGEPKMERKTANKVINQVKREIIKMKRSRCHFQNRYHRWLEQVDADKVARAEKHIDRYHLRVRSTTYLEGASRPKQSAHFSFFNHALHFNDDLEKQAKYRNSAEQFLREQSDGVEAQLNRLYLKLLTKSAREETQRLKEEQERRKKDFEEEMRMTLMKRKDDDEKAKPQTNTIDEDSVSSDTFVTSLQPITKDDEMEAKTDDVATNSDLIPYDFGVQQNYFYLQPRFNSFREELLCNDRFSYSNCVFRQILEKAIRAYCEISRGKNFFDCSWKYAPEHGILRNGKVTIKHIAAILCCTDLTKFRLYFIVISNDVHDIGIFINVYGFFFIFRFRDAFRATFRRIEGDSTDKDVMNRHTAFYHIGRALFEAVEYFGKVLEPNRKVFHGLNKKVYFTSFSEYFNIPMWPTKKKIIGMFTAFLSL